MSLQILINAVNLASARQEQTITLTLDEARAIYKDSASDKSEIQALKSVIYYDSLELNELTEELEACKNKG